MINGIDIAIRNRNVPTPQRGAFRGLAAAIIITGFLGGAVICDGGGISVSDNVAFAKGGNGGSGGKGGGGGRGGGKKGDHGDVAGDGHAKGRGHGHAKGHGRGHAKSDGNNNGSANPPGAPSLEHDSASKNGISAAALGSLNAANASSTARENASPKSMVGQIAAFADAAESKDIDAAAKALAAKANKPIDEDVVTEVARKVDVEVSEETARAIAESAAAIQAGESEEPMGQSMPSGS